MAEQKCRVCGCTDEYACEGGCYWVEKDLCSSCSDGLEDVFLPDNQQITAPLQCNNSADSQQSNNFPADSSNLEQKEGDVSNSTHKNKKSVSKALRSSKSSKEDEALTYVRSLVFKIRYLTKGKLNFSRISERCGWCSSRVSQILKNWDNPKYVSPNSKKKIKEKLEECLESLNRTIKEGVDENGKESV